MLRKLNRLIALAEKKGIIFLALQRRERGWNVDFYDPRQDVACNHVSGVIMTKHQPDPMSAIAAAMAWVEVKEDKALPIDAYRP